MESPNVFEEKDWGFNGLFHRRLVGVILLIFAKKLLADSFASACIASVIRLYFSVRLFNSEDVTYFVALMGLWTLPEMALAFLAMCLPVFPRFFQSLKSLHSYSWISISQRYLFRSFKTSSYQPSPDHFVLPTNQPKKSTLWPGKHDSSVYIGTGASNQVPVDNCSKSKTGNLQIMRSIQIHATNQSGNAGLPSFTKGVSTGW